MWAGTHVSNHLCDTMSGKHTSDSRVYGEKKFVEKNKSVTGNKDRGQISQLISELRLFRPCACVCYGYKK